MWLVNLKDGGQWSARMQLVDQYISTRSKAISGTLFDLFSLFLCRYQIVYRKKAWLLKVGLIYIDRQLILKKGIGYHKNKTWFPNSRRYGQQALRAAHLHFSFNNVEFKSREAYLKQLHFTKIVPYYINLLEKRHNCVVFSWLLSGVIMCNKFAFIKRPFLCSIFLKLYWMETIYSSRWRSLCIKQFMLNSWNKREIKTGPPWDLGRPEARDLVWILQ